MFLFLCSTHIQLDPLPAARRPNINSHYVNVVHFQEIVPRLAIRLSPQCPQTKLFLLKQRVGGNHHGILCIQNHVVVRDGSGTFNSILYLVN